MSAAPAASTGTSATAISGSRAGDVAEDGFHELKLVPAEFAGGIGWLKHIEPIYPDLVFCPTAGSNVRDFLACPNLLAVGADFPAPRDRIETSDWPAIGQLSRQALVEIEG
jgi:2-dehydro-3-deoxyphosphogluconate aldolase/(4S)-4-hydroxy-2-oxoglutarate aldolase